MVPALPAPGPALFRFAFVALSPAHPQIVPPAYGAREPSACIPALFRFAFVALSPAHPQIVPPAYGAREPSACILALLYPASPAQPLPRSVYLPMTTFLTHKEGMLRQNVPVLYHP